MCLFGSFSSNNVISDHQCGFQPGKPTETALHDIKNVLIQNTEIKLFTIGLFLDFSKVFDSVQHDILLTKLEIYEIRGLAKDLMESYLTGRQQYTRLRKNPCSDHGTLKYGLPQGSVLGPLLYTTYISDIINISSTLNIILYADNTNIFSGLYLKELQHQANIWLDKLHAWLIVNQLTLNVKKN